MIKCIVIDDEKPARDEISYLIESHEDFKVLASYDNGKEFLEALDTLDFDILFVDVNMPVMNGIETVEHMSKYSDAHVVFVTAYDDYAIKAFELNAIDYLLKPVSEERMSKCINRILNDLVGHEYTEKLNDIISQFKDRQEHICFHKDGKIFPVKLNEILYAKAENKGTLICTKKDCFSSSIQLRELEKKLMVGNFFRCHRSYLINLDYIKHIEPWFNRTFQIEMEETEEKIPISRNYVQGFKELMNIL